MVKEMENLRRRDNTERQVGICLTQQMCHIPVGILFQNGSMIENEGNPNVKFLFHALNNIGFPNKGKGSPFWCSAFNKTVTKYSGRFQSYQATVKLLFSFIKLVRKTPSFLFTFITSASVKSYLIFYTVLEILCFWDSRIPIH